jgi:hypothetical protein
VKFVTFLLKLLSPSLLAFSVQAIEFHSGPYKVQLLELYSSQGCSSCPPAQHWISGFVDQPELWTDFIPVVFHVDYWDGLGWKDPYSLSEFSQRQQRYKRQGLSKGVYTPGFIFDGQEWKGWFTSKPLPLRQNQAAELSVTVSDRDVKVIYKHNSNDLIVNIAVLGVGISTEIESGENRSRLLKEDFIILDFQQHSLANFHQQSQWQGTLPLMGKAAPRYALAVWVSQGHKLQPLQAVGGWLEE